MQSISFLSNYLISLSWSCKGRSARSYSRHCYLWIVLT